MSYLKLLPRTEIRSQEGALDPRAERLLQTVRNGQRHANRRQTHYWGARAFSAGAARSAMSSSNDAVLSQSIQPSVTETP